MEQLTKDKITASKTSLSKRLKQHHSNTDTPQLDENCQSCNHKQLIKFFLMLVGCPKTNLGHSSGDSLTNPILITAFVKFRPEGH